MAIAYCDVQSDASKMHNAKVHSILICLTDSHTKLKWIVTYNKKYCKLKKGVSLPKKMNILKPGFRFNTVYLNSVWDHCYNPIYMDILQDKNIYLLCFWKYISYAVK